MGKLRVLCSVLVVSFAACGDDGSATPDAPVVTLLDAPAAPPDAYFPDAFVPDYDFSCYQNQAPTMAEDTVTLSGTAQEVVGMSIGPASGVTLQACRGDCTGPDDLGATEPTGANGMFTTAALATGGEPLDAYLIATKAGSVPTRVYPAAPLTTSQVGIPVLMMSELIYGFIDQFIEHAPGNALLGIFVTDCVGTPVGGVTVSLTQEGQSVGGAPVDAGFLDPQFNGAWIVGNVPPGDTTVSATYMGMTFRAHVVAGLADTITTTQVAPGY